MSDELKDLMQFEALLVVLCVMTSILLALLWSIREVRGYAAAERSVKIGLSMILGMAFAVVSGILYVDFPGWLFLANLAGLPILCCIVVASLKSLAGLFPAGFFKKRSSSSKPVGEPVMEYQPEAPRRSSGTIEVPIKPIANISRQYRRHARRA